MLSFECLWALCLLPLPLLLRQRVAETAVTGLRVPFYERAQALAATGAGSGSALQWWRRLCASVVWVLVILALARPVWLLPPQAVPQLSRDVMVAVDISSSMQLTDMPANSRPEGGLISRLDYVKQFAESLLASQQDTRFGLIVYGSAAYLQVPFTSDFGLFDHLLQEVQVGMAGPKTMLGDAIGLAVRHFEQTHTAALGQREQVVLLISDGNDTGSPVPVPEVAALAAQRGIRIHTLFVGEASAAEASSNVELLQIASAVSGGQHFAAAGDANALAAKLNTVLPHHGANRYYQPRLSVYHWPLLMALALAVVGVILAWFRQRNAATAAGALDHV